MNQVNARKINNRTFNPLLSFHARATKLNTSLLFFFSNSTENTKHFIQAANVSRKKTRIQLCC